MIRISPVKRFAQRGTAGIAIIIGFILLVVTAALVITSMVSMNSTRSEDLGERATQAAWTGLSQFLLDVEAGILNAGGGVSLTVQPNFTSDYTIYASQPDPFATANAAVTAGTLTAYPIPNAASFLEGKCYITFNSTAALGIPYSTSRLNLTTDGTGWNNRVVPAHSVDVIATGEVNGVQRSIAARVTRQWSYAVTAAHQIFVAGGNSTGVAGDLGGQIFGNVFNMACGDGIPAVTVGADAYGTPWPGCRVSGVISTAGTDSAEFKAYLDGEWGGTRTGARVLRYPNIQAPDPDATWISLTSAAFQTTHAGFTVTQEMSGGTPTGVYDLDYTGGSDAPLSLSGANFYLDGDLKIPQASRCNGISLDQALLRLRPGLASGSLTITDKVCKMLGTNSALICDGNLTFYYGFVDGNTDNFVVMANNLDCMAGGVLKGLVIVENQLVMRSAPADPGTYKIGGLGPLQGLVPVSLSTGSPTATASDTSTPATTTTPTGAVTPPPATPTVPAVVTSPQVTSMAAAVSQVPDPASQLYQLEIDGAVVARNISSVVPTSSAPYLVLGGVQVKYDAQYLQVLNVDAPLFISSIEVMKR